MTFDREDGWIRKRQRPARPEGPSTVDGTTAWELAEERVAEIRAMSPEELEAYVAAAAESARTGAAEASEAAAERRAWRYRMN